MGPIQIALVGTVDFVVLALGLYHFTHHGKGSGTLELVSAVLLTLALFLPRTLGKLWQVIFIGVVALVLVSFGVYHLSTPDGHRSGTLELIGFACLAFAMFLSLRSFR